MLQGRSAVTTDQLLTNFNALLPEQAAERLRQAHLPGVGHRTRVGTGTASAHAASTSKPSASISASISPIDFDYWGWGMEKYERAVRTFDSPDFDRMLESQAGFAVGLVRVLG